ncbi:MAG: hypothetical protein ACXWW4_15930 [Candidatus Binatia bacterium]
MKVVLSPRFVELALLQPAHYPVSPELKEALMAAVDMLAKVAMQLDQIKTRPGEYKVLKSVVLPTVID